jgi:2-amino-4-hydroxy-6-hydroxymethyldihydropteridine diphosphokinase
VSALDVVVGLGGNLGEREATLASAVRELAAMGRVLAVSGLFETAPVGPVQPAFLNAAVRLESPLSAHGLLEALLGVERRHGRVRRERWGPRTLDLDILWISGIVVAEPELTVPHAELHARRFALEPLLEVAPDARDPTTGEALSAWVAALPDQGVRRVTDFGWVTASSPPGADFEPR